MRCPGTKTSTARGGTSTATPTGMAATSSRSPGGHCPAWPTAATGGTWYGHLCTQPALTWPPDDRRWGLPSRPAHCPLRQQVGLVGPRRLRSRRHSGGLIAATGRRCGWIATATGGRRCRVVAATGRLLSGGGPVDPRETPLSPGLWNRPRKRSLLSLSEISPGIFNIFGFTALVISLLLCILVSSRPIKQNKQCASNPLVTRKNPCIPRTS